MTFAFSKPSSTSHNTCLIGFVQTTCGNTMKYRVSNNSEYAFQTVFSPMIFSGQPFNFQRLSPKNGTLNPSKGPYTMCSNYIDAPNYVCILFKCCKAQTNCCHRFGTGSFHRFHLQKYQLVGLWIRQFQFSSAAFMVLPTQLDKRVQSEKVLLYGPQPVVFCEAQKRRHGIQAREAVWKSSHRPQSKT